MDIKEPIVLHTDPDFVVLYTKKWAAQVKKKHSPAEAAMAEDIATLVEIGRAAIIPASDPAEPGNEKTK